MDDNRFASWMRSINSRRAVSGAIAATVASLLGLTRATEVGAAACPKGKKRCGDRCIPKRGCCTSAQCRPRNSGKVCKKARCVCPAGTRRCGKRCLPRAAACPPQPDAACPAGGEFFVRAGVALRVAQTFTEPNGGLLNAAEFFIRNESAATTGTYELRLNTVHSGTGVPQATTLGLAQRSSDNISDTTLDWVRFAFPTPPRLHPRQQYALVLTLVDGSAGWVSELRSDDFCPGDEFFVAEIAGPFEVQIGFDLPYQTFVTA